MAYPITIYATLPGKFMGETLQIALGLLRSKAIPVDAAAELRSGNQHVSTILMSTEEARTKAIDVLSGAGFSVKAGSAGI